MKKLLLVAMVGIAVMFTGCRVTKTITMLTAKNRATITEEKFLEGKHLAVDFLVFTETQKQQLDALWKSEKKSLNEIKLENENIAPIIYKSELDFRKILNAEQLSKYIFASNEYDSRIGKFFLNDQAMAELKRIYKL